MSHNDHPIKELPEWAQSLFADFLSAEMHNDATMFQCATLEDTHRAFEMMMRAYVAGYRDRTKGLRPVPKIRDYPPQAQATKGKAGPPPLPPQGPFNKGR